jgi:hypothetical protein
VLLDAGANPELSTPGDEIPLYAAAKRCDVNMINLLLGHGADPEARCVGDFGDTISEYAKNQVNNHPIILHLLTTSKRPRVPLKN